MEQFIIGFLICMVVVAFIGGYVLATHMHAIAAAAAAKVEAKINAAVPAAAPAAPAAAGAH